MPDPPALLPVVTRSSSNASGSVERSGRGGLVASGVGASGVGANSGGGDGGGAAAGGGGYDGGGYDGGGCAGATSPATACGDGGHHSLRRRLRWARLGLAWLTTRRGGDRRPFWTLAWAGGGGGGGGGGGSGGGGNKRWGVVSSGSRGGARRPSAGCWWLLTAGLAAALTIVVWRDGRAGGGRGGESLAAAAALSPAQRSAAGVAAAALSAASRGGADGCGGGGGGGDEELETSLARWTDDAYARSRLRVYVYDLPDEYNEALVRLSHAHPPKIRDPLCDESFYSAEVSFHRFLLRSAVRTRDPDEANLFYVPIYTTCYLLTHQPNNLESTGAHFARGMDHVMGAYPYFNRSGGRDHVYTFTQGFGARHAGHWERYRNGIFLVHNGEWTAAEFTPHKDVVLPPDLTHYLTPAFAGDPLVSGAGETAGRGGRGGGMVPKSNFFHFGGQVLDPKLADARGSNHSGGVRQYVVRHLAHRPGYVLTGVRSPTYLADMAASRFCLCPEGWHPWSPRPVYAVLLGCIPVVVSERQELPLSDRVDWDAWTVWVRPAEVAGMDAALRAIPDADVAARQAAMRRAWRALWWGAGGLAPQGVLAELAARAGRVHYRRHFSRPPPVAAAGGRPPR